MTTHAAFLVLALLVVFLVVLFLNTQAALEGAREENAQLKIERNNLLDEIYRERLHRSITPMTAEVALYEELTQ